MAETVISISFPKSGIDLSLAPSKQPNRPAANGEYARTTPVGNNVRGFEALTRRSRGGTRPGLSKYGSVIDAGWIVQHLDTITTTGGSPVEQSQSGRAVYLVAVSQGVLKWILPPASGAWNTPTNNTGASPPLNFTGLMRSAANNQKLYVVDGVNYRFFDPANNSMENWTASAGALPVDAGGNTARLIATWRGRTVLSGLPEDSQNWFMSRVGDPTDFDYSSVSNDPAQAIAGNNSKLGLIGDTVTALISYTDDLLVVGGDSSIWMFRGDPLYGGQIDSISNSIGMAWGEAYCQDQEGNLYFFSNMTGIFVMAGGQAAPQRLSQAIDQLLTPIDTGNYGVRLLWNDRFQGLHVFVTPLAEPGATTHFFWEKRSGAWWTDTFGNHDLDPLCCVTYDGNLPTDRVPLIGSWDGYVRAIDPAAVDDDGTDIDSRVLIGPLTSKTLDELRLDELQAVLANGSAVVTYKVYAGETAELALAAANAVSPVPDEEGTFDPDRNVTEYVRVAGHAIYVELSCSDRWAMEAIRARFDGAGMVRRRAAPRS